MGRFKILNMTTLQDRIRLALRKAGKNANELAIEININRATVSLWVNGPTKTIKGDNLTKAARALNVNAHWLSTGEGRRSAHRADDKPEEIEVYNADRDIMRKIQSLGVDDQVRIRIFVDALLQHSAKNIRGAL